MKIAYRLSKMIACGGLLALLGLTAGAGTALAAENAGTLKWRFLAKDFSKSSPAIDRNGIIYVGSVDPDNTLYAVKPDGKQLWSKRLAGPIESSPTIMGPYIFVGSADWTTDAGAGMFYCISRDNGAIDWSVKTVGVVTSTAAFDRDWDTVCWGSHGDYLGHNSQLYFYDFRSKKVSNIDTGTTSPVRSSPAYTDVGDIFYVGVGNYFCAYTAWDQRQIWKSYTGSQTSSPAIDLDGNIYVGSSDQACLYAFDPKGNVRWNTKAYTKGSVRSSPVINGATGPIYVGCDDYYVYAFHSNGQQIWKFKTEMPVQSSPAIGSDGTIYVVSMNGTLYCLWEGDGALLWKYAVGSYTESSSPAIGPDGTIYVGSQNGLYAINSGGTKLTGSAWPMFHQNLEHTGQKKRPPSTATILLLLLEAMR